MSYVGDTQRTELCRLKHSANTVYFIINKHFEEAESLPFYSVYEMKISYIIFRILDFYII